MKNVRYNTRTFIWRTLLFSLVLSCAATFVNSQNLPDGLTFYQENFINAVDKKDMRTARGTLSYLEKSDSSTMYKVIPWAEELLMPREKKKIGKEDLLKLNSLYQMSSRHDPGHIKDWQMKSALIFIRFSEEFSDKEILVKTWDLIWAMGPDSPKILLEVWFKAAYKEFGSKILTPGEVIFKWSQIEKWILESQVSRPEDYDELLTFQFRARLDLREMMGPCEEMTLETDYKGKCIMNLLIYDLKECSSDEDWKRSCKACLGGSDDAWAFHLCAGSNLNTGNYSLAADLWDLAAHNTPSTGLKGVFKLYQAQAQALNGDFRTARSTITEVMELLPDWSEPYFSMTDLYISGMAECSFSEFDRKAINWLLIELCQQARNINPEAEPEASRRIYQYKKRLPGNADLKFRNLKEGDTWPLRCWINRVVTVRNS